jgi:hypothetical protein
MKRQKNRKLSDFVDALTCFSDLSESNNKNDKIKSARKEDKKVKQKVSEDPEIVQRDISETENEICSRMNVPHRRLLLHYLRVLPYTVLF